MGRPRVFTLRNPKSIVAEAYRSLRTNIQFSSIDKPIKSIVFTSAILGEGKSTTAINTAITMGQSDKKVLLIDCDLRKPKLHLAFTMGNTKGLTNILVAGEDYKDVLYEAKGVKWLDVIGSGPIPPDPAEILGSNKMKKFLEEMENEYDMVILDTPPIAAVTDSVILSNIVDGTILVCSVGEADINVLKRAKDLLEKANANILGVVMNKIPMNNAGYYKYYYGEYYDYSQDDTLTRTGKRGRRKRNVHA